MLIKTLCLCVLALVLTSCGVMKTEVIQTPSPVITQMQTRTPIITKTEPTSTKTPVPTYVLVTVTEVGNYLTISEVFTVYGQPKEIWFSSTGKVPENWPTYVDILLFYPEDTIIFEFGGKAEQSNDGNRFFISICSAKYDDTTIEEFVTTSFSWSPKTLLNFDDLPPLPGQSGKHWKLLDEVTDNNLSGFYYGTLTNPKTACLKTPAEIWPNPDL